MEKKKKSVSMQIQEIMSVNIALQVFLLLVVTEHMMMVHPQGNILYKSKVAGSSFSSRSMSGSEYGTDTGKPLYRYFSSTAN